MANIFSNTNITIDRYYVDTGETSRQTFHNLIVTNGLNIMRNHLLSTLSTTALWPNNFMLGTGTTAAYSTDTALQSSAYSLIPNASSIICGFHLVIIDF